MKQKLKMFYECMRPNIALLMATILVVSLLSVGMVKETKAADSGGRTAWLDAEGVAGETFEFKGVTTQESYTAYSVEGGKCIPETVMIDSLAELGSKSNPYAIDSEEDLILFGKLNASSYKGKYFILTKDVYDMQGDTMYMTPLFPCVYTPSAMYDTGFQSNFIGNQAVIKNIYLRNTYGNSTYIVGLFGSVYSGAVIQDLNVEDATYQIENERGDYLPIGGLVGGNSWSKKPIPMIINCDISYAINYNSTRNAIVDDLSDYYLNVYNCNVTLTDITSDANITIEAVCPCASWEYNEVYNCSSTIMKENVGITTTDHTNIYMPGDDGAYATVTIPSTNIVYREGVEIYAPENTMNLYNNGAFAFGDTSKEIKINNEICGADKIYNTIKLDYTDDETETIIYPAGESCTLPNPTDEEFEFLGWTGGDITEPTKDVVISEEFIGACIYTANWGLSKEMEACDVTFNNSDAYTFTGEEIKPVVLVKDGDTFLEEDKDYKVSYLNNVNVADKDSTDAPAVVVEGIGKYAGTKTLYFTIGKATLDIKTVPTAGNIYVGTALEYSALIGGVAVNVNDMEVPGTFSWKDGSIVPTLADSGVTKYTVVFTPEDSANYNTVEVDMEVVVEQKPFADMDISFNEGSVYTYTGKEIKPVVIVKDKDTILEEDKDYEVSYLNNTYVANKDSTDAPAVVVEGIGKYAGTKTLYFTIGKATLDIKTVPTAGKIYVGTALASSALTGGEAVNVNDMEVSGTFSWKDGSIVPTLADSGVTKYTVVFTPEDSANYNTVEVDMEVEIEPKPFADIDISFNEGSVYTYTGKEIKPVVIVKDKDTILEEDKDYEVSYLNNTYVANKDSTDAPAVVVEGIGKYAGTKTLYFTIGKATLDIKTVPTAGNIYVGTALEYSALIGGVAVNVNDMEVPGTFSWKDGSIVPTLADSGVTKYKVVFAPSDTNNYNTAEIDISIIVEKKPLIHVDGCEIIFNNGETYRYTGKEIKPVILVKDGDTFLEEDEDYKVSYLNNINAADKDLTDAPTVVVEGIGQYTGSKTLNFTIEKATPLIHTMPTAGKIQEGQALEVSALTGGVALSGLPTNGDVASATGANVVEGTFSWKDGTVVPTVADSGVTKYMVVFTPDDKNNYNTFEFGITVVVEPKANTDQSGTGGTEEPDSGNTNPTDPGEGKVEQPQVGEKISDKKGDATYKITSSEKDVVEVSYVASVKKTEKVKIPTTVTLEDGTTAKVTSIGAGAFKKNTKVKEVTIGTNIKTIGKEAFSGCKNLKKVTGAKNVTKIEKNAFANCKKLSSVAMGSKLTTIGEKAFYKCTGLKKITIPKKVKTIEKSAFEGCKNLKTINIKTTKLTKSNVKNNAFKGIHSKAKIDVPNNKKKVYTSLLHARGVSKKATIR